MKTRTLWKRSLRHYWRTYLWVGVAVLVMTSALTSSLILGDSLRDTLTKRSQASRGEATHMWTSQSRWFRDALAARLSTELNAPVVPMLSIPAMAYPPDDPTRALAVRLIGVPANAGSLDPDWDLPRLAQGDVQITQEAAHRLEIKTGNEIVVRFWDHPDTSSDLPMGRSHQKTLALRGRVVSIAPRSSLAELRDGDTSSRGANVFVPLSWLQDRLGRKGRANRMLMNVDVRGEHLRLEEALKRHLRFIDLGLSWRKIGASGVWQLESERILIHPEIVASARKLRQWIGGQRELWTWFSYEVRNKGKVSPFAFVNASTERAGDPATVAPGTIHINQWLADDLEAQLGDSIDLVFPVFVSGGPPRKREASFRITKILPMDAPGSGRHLSPGLPGFQDAEHCRDWAPGFPLDLKQLRPRDEDYWKQHGASPKAFISMEDATRLWNNSFGVRTAIQVEGTGASHMPKLLLAEIDPGALGFRLIALEERAKGQGQPANDLGTLFLGLSSLIIISSFLLVIFLFSHNLSQRSEEIDTRWALGHPRREIRATLVREGIQVSIPSVLLGVLAGVGLAHLFRNMLQSTWAEAVGGMKLDLAIRPTTIATAGLAGVIITWIAAQFSFWRTAQSRPQRRRLRGRAASLWIALVGTVCVVAVLLTLGRSQAVLAFMVAGPLTIFTMLSWIYYLLVRVKRTQTNSTRNLASLGRSMLSRRPGRSIISMSVIALGCFLVTAVSANRRTSLDYGTDRDSATGGFALYAESILPIQSSWNNSEARAQLGLAQGETPPMKVIPFQLRDADDASCLSPAQSQEPTLLGVDPQLLADRGAFRVKDALRPSESSTVWSLLDADVSPGIIPAIGDEATLRWGLHVQVGDRLQFHDQTGAVRQLEIVAMLHDSILQGRLIISRRHFHTLFPDLSGDRVFLLDVAPNDLQNTKELWTDLFGDQGIHFEEPAHRMARFNAVQNTYLSMFQVLATLGLMLGILSMSVLVIHQCQERRGELQMLLAIGFTSSQQARLLRWEYGWILFWGCLAGIVGSLLALVPHRDRLSLDQSALPVVITVVSIGLVSIISTWLVARSSSAQITAGTNWETSP